MIGFDQARGPAGLRIYAIGDVHGRFDLLQGMHRLIARENAKQPPHDWLVIHLGDYVDRGPQSREVLDLLARETLQSRNMLALAGNHDIGLLDFLSTGDAFGVFAHNGGRQTALSYGVDIDFDDAVSVLEGWKELVRAIPDAHKQFLRGLKRSVAFGDFYFCHAGIRPGVALDLQNADDLIWIRGEFLNNPTLHPKVIVHGHTPVDDADIRSNRVNLDTGAFASSRLSGLMIEEDRKLLLEVTQRDDVLMP
ncbi:serine/threonine protein phosphatase [Phyllobacterium sp. SYP-B3895]|uniref:metallophosphoesterase n=1 Tax=Phyllobacterium sp. SYP-B3895 TaxID=2663240 RepID=UPI001299C2DC|nr:metallophosphoesterase [Phyllobacterium sp. SYP-B3895]MRG56278.1 serine/threonine protein phosphatase [Phyllobacterium sp. SYP-B3895]